jgi:hypothetical protein
LARDGTPVKLRNKEFDLAAFLFRNAAACRHAIIFWKASGDARPVLIHAPWTPMSAGFAISSNFPANAALS